MNIPDTITKLKTFVDKQISSLAMTNPLVNFAKPLITRVVNNNIHKVDRILSMVADENGNIDMHSLISETVQNVVNAQPFVYNTEFLGDLEIGGGCIKVNIPFTNNKVVITQTDLEALRDLFIENRG